MPVAVGQVLIPSSTELRDQYLRDIRLAAIDTGVDEPPVEPGSDWYIEGTATANAFEVVLANQSLYAQDTDVLNATGEALDRIRRQYGLPEVPAQGSSGKIKITVTGATSIPSGTVIKLPNGLRIQTVGAVISPSDGQEIDVTAIDVGAATNLAGGEAVQFVSPPTNVAREAKVSTSAPLTGGTDAETDARKRDRILNTLRYKPAGGNWAYLRQMVLDRFGNVQDCYIYPTPGGPASQVIVPVKAFDRDSNDYSRALSSAALQAIRGLLQSDANTGIETVVRASADQSVDFTIKVDIPQSALSGGNGQGWIDPDPWPSLEVADSNTITITAVNSDNDSLTLDAQTSSAPVDGQTHIAWWSPADRKSYTALVESHSGSAGAWVVNLDRPLVGEDGVGPAVGDYVCPDAQNLSAYGETWVSLFEELGAGEITADANRLPRSKRHPYATDEDPHSVTNSFLGRLNGKHPEITDIEFGSAATTTPTVPASVDDSPSVLVPRHFAVYPL
jgi:uncharacterized phage protein gp47/JayE